MVKLARDPKPCNAKIQGDVGAEFHKKRQRPLKTYLLHLVNLKNYKHQRPT